ncbi:MAG TPA: DUF5700 domain-containing putative Zn-dependent protease [Thermoanaerobaculia bacterium]|nr:DUF5700 domain-containing putative Zn-dependent protease [Thermoanaerobaculia bacterium]
MRRALLLLALSFAAWAAGCSSSSSSPSAKSAPGVPASRSPYDAPPAAAHSIQIQIDATAAREILGTLSRQKFDPSDAKVLQDLPAIHLTIQDSTRGSEVFERDLAAAFGETSKSTVFDFWKIRQERTRWEALLSAIVSREKDVARLSSERAAALLPGDRPVSAVVHVYLSFGIAGLADHLVLADAKGQDTMVIDLSRALGDSQGEPLDSQISRLARLIAGEAFRQSWLLYRSASPAWQRGRSEGMPIDQLLTLVGETGPVALFAVDENFFPLAVWLKTPMKRAIDDLNRSAERFAQAKDNLEARVELTGELKRPAFARQVAAPAGAFLADAVVQSSGLDALRAGLQKGPRGLFEAYDKVYQSDKNLIPLGQAIRQRIK